MNNQLTRQTAPFTHEVNKTSMEQWHVNRKRSRVDEEERSFLPGLKAADMFPSKTKRASGVLFKRNISQTGCVTRPSYSNDRPHLIPLSDITHQSHVSHCRLGRQNGSEGRRRKADRGNGSLTSSGNPDVVTMVMEKTPSAQLRPGDQTVTYVNNLFSPVSKLQAIPLTLSELQRRTEYPEYFGRSELVTYLRHSKTTGNEIMEKYDLKPTSSRSKLNVLSRLCEREAKTLANGIHTMNSEYFPMSYVAETMKQQMGGEKKRSVSEQRSEAKEINDTKETITSTIDLLQSLKKSLRDPEEDLAEDLEIFEKATHTFGCQNILNHIGFVESYLEELHKKL